MSKPIAETFEEQIALINPAKPLRLYRNLNRSVDGQKGWWSAKQGIVRFHCSNIRLKNVRFLVNEKLRQQVVDTKQKVVHAFVEGYLTKEDYSNLTEIRYNPYEGPTFRMGESSISTANFVHLFRDGNAMKVMG